MTLKDLANQRKELTFDDRELRLGLSSHLNWIWSNGNKVSRTINLWGPGEPKGYYRCGLFLNAISKDAAWKGYGWRWGDGSCTTPNGYICEEPLGRLADNSYTNSNNIYRLASLKR